MDTLRSVAHLQKELGDDLFNILVSSDNTAAVREFAKTLAKDALPTTMTVGGRTYDLLGFLQGDEKSVVGPKMVERAKDMQANLGEEDGQHILKHQDEIPVELQGKVVFVFTDWRRPEYPEFVAYINWNGDRWVQHWLWLALDYWYGNGRVLRRK